MMPYWASSCSSRWLKASHGQMTVMSAGQGGQLVQEGPKAPGATIPSGPCCPHPNGESISPGCRALLSGHTTFGVCRMGALPRKRVGAAGPGRGPEEGGPCCWGEGTARALFFSSPSKHSVDPLSRNNPTRVVSEA